MRKVFLCLMLLLTALAVFLYPSVSDQWFGSGDQPLPPGVRGSERDLLRIWVLDDACGAMKWLKKQSAAFEKTDGAARIRLRTASQTEVELLLSGDERVVAPDVLIFSLGALGETGERLLPVALPEGISDAFARAGRYQDKQMLVPLCASGYALVIKSDQPVVTPEPTSLLGLRAPAPSPGTTVEPTADLGALTDAYAAPPLGGALLALLGAPAHIQAVGDQSNAPGALSSGASAALLTLAQLHALPPGTGEAVAAAGATDLVSFAALCTDSARAFAFVEFLVSAPAQNALRDHHLLSVRSDTRLYDASAPAWMRFEQEMASGIMVPNAFVWRQARETVALSVDAARRNGEDVRHVLEPLR